MRRGTRLALLLAGTSGCSLVYDPGRLPVDRDDAAVTDAVVTDGSGPPVITGLESGPLFEGQGSGGSRPAVIRIVGSNLDRVASWHARWTDGGVVTIDDTGVAADGSAVVITVTFAVDATRESGRRQLLVTAGGNTTAAEGSTLVEMHPELVLDAGTTVNATLAPRYSRIEVMGPVRFGQGSTAVVLRSSGEIVVAGAVMADGVEGVGGPAACTSGCPGGGKPGPKQKGGGGGGFGSAGSPGASLGGDGGQAVGDGWLIPFGAGANRGQPGGTGAEVSALGGGGGGALALWADGDVTLGEDVRAGGGDGRPSGGGGGSGGAILVHAGGTLRATGGQVRTPGGMGARNAGIEGGAGGVGRVRFDAAVVEAVGGLTALVSDGVSYRGPAFVPDTPSIVASGLVTLRVIAAPDTSLTLTGAVAPLTVATNATGVATFVGVQLERGVSHLCVAPSGAAEAMGFGESCVDIALP